MNEFSVNGITGIICELNPPHAGHYNLIYRASQGRALPIVCVMSGNFVQRGEPAIYDKMTRAGIAMDYGASLVVELPVQYALSSAETFARAGVFILNALNAQFAAFGTESADIHYLLPIAEAMLDPRADVITKILLKNGLPYNAARAEAISGIAGENSGELLKSANNLLAASYIAEIMKQKAEISPLPFERTPGISSSAIRNSLQSAGPFPDSLDIAVISRLRMMPLNEMLQIQGSGDGAAERLYKAARTAATIKELAVSVKTKRFAFSRIRRLIICTALGITEKEFCIPHIRVLALNDIGAKILKSSRIPVVSKPADAKLLGETSAAQLNLDCAATDLYNLAYTDPSLRCGGAEWVNSPIKRD